MVEFKSSVEEGTPLEWVLFVDGSSNIKESGIGIILEGPVNILIEPSLKFEFTTSNKQAE